MIAKNLEMEIISECQYKNNVTEGRSRLQVPAKRKVDSGTLSPSSNKRMRISPRFMNGTENEGEENLGKSKEKGKSLASGSPSRRSPRLSGTVANGHTETLNTRKDGGAEQVRGTEKLVQISENDNCREAIKKYEGDSIVSSKQELLVFPSSCIKKTVNGSRDKTLGKSRSSEPKADDTHTSSLENRENGTTNGLTMTTAFVEQESMESLLQGKANDRSAADKGITEEKHVNSTVIYLSDSDEQSSVEYL